MRAAAVVYVKDIERMRCFYQQCFGLKAAETTEDYCVLESDAWTLSLVVMPDETAAAINVAVPPRRRGEVPVKLAFDVPSIEGLRAIVTGLGGQVDSSTTAWDFRGVRHCDGVDPEGNVIQLLAPLARPVLAAQRPPAEGLVQDGQAER